MSNAVQGFYEAIAKPSVVGTDGWRDQTLYIPC
jgi:hypothetical protein